MFVGAQKIMVRLTRAKVMPTLTADVPCELSQRLSQLSQLATSICLRAKEHQLITPSVAYMFPENIIGRNCKNCSSKTISQIHLSNFACIFTPCTFPEKANPFLFQCLDVFPVFGGVSIIFLINNFDECAPLIKRPRRHTQQLATQLSATCSSTPMAQQGEPLHPPALF